MTRVPAHWRIKRSLRGKRGHIASELFGATVVTVMGGWGVAAMVLILVLAEPGPDGGEIALAVGWIVGSALLITLGLAMGREQYPDLMRREDRIWLDGTELRWVRHRPRWRRGEPTRVDRAGIVRVRLSDGDAGVMVSTADGTDHLVTDLGTLAERVALATAIGDRLGPGTAWVHPESPPELPHAWVTLPGPDEGTRLVWRRPNAGRPWGVLLLGYPLVLTVLIAPAHLGGWALAGVLLLVAAAAAGLVRWFRHEIRLTGPGWLVRDGRLDAVRMLTRAGRSPGRRHQVHALELVRGRWPGQRRLLAVLAEERRLVASGWDRRIDGLAAWLAGRADLPLADDRR